MKAAVYDRYGPPDVVRIAELPERSPGEGQVLLRVGAAALNPKDVLTRKGKYRWIDRGRFPRRLGYDFAGEVLAVGPGVSERSVGERVFGMIDAWRGGAIADRLVLKAADCAPAPANLSDAEAAALPLVSLTALQALRDVAGVQPGMAVIIHGASGGLGTHAIQVARALGAVVTTTSSAANLELCRSLGAGDALDYRKADPWAAAGRWDVIFDVFGDRRFERVRASLRSPGVFVSTVPSMRLARAMALNVFSRRRPRIVVVRARPPDMSWVRQAASDGRLRPVVDRVFPLEQIGDAQRYLETKRARGKVVIAIRG